jgi:hypothetical protein
MKMYKLMPLKREVINAVADVIANSNTEMEFKRERITYISDLIANCDDMRILEEVLNIVGVVK